MKTLLSLALLMLLSCGQIYLAKKKEVVDNFYLSYSKEELQQKIDEILLISSDSNRKDSLRKFFNNWSKSIPSNSVDFINQDDTMKEVFAVFKTVYRPFDLLKLGDWERGNKLNANCEFVTIQNSIGYQVEKADRKNRFGSTKFVLNFRPPIDLDSSKVQYLISEYRYAIYYYLADASTKFGDNNIMNPVLPYEEYWERYRSLRQFIPILHGHTKGWHIDTDPNVELITFNESLTKAKIEFSVGYEGGKATLVKSDGKWTIIETEMTWIQ